MSEVPLYLAVDVGDRAVQRRDRLPHQRDPCRGSYLRLIDFCITQL